MAVKIRVSADTSSARRDLSRLEQSVNSIDKTAKNVTRSLTRLAQGIATAFGTSVALKSINNATNGLIELENRIALVTGRTEQLNKSLDNLYAIARQSRQPVELAAETFNRFGIALRDANVSVEEIEKATLAVQRSVALSGGNIESARAAIFQLGQGLASGTLRGQELNSVLEQAPRIATAIADDLGVGVGALRAMAAEGKITTDVVFNALLNQSTKLEEEFQALEQTSSQAFIVFNNTLQRTVGNISRTLGITQTFTNTFNGLTDVLLESGKVFELDLYAGIAGFNDALYDTSLIMGGVLNVTKAFAGRFVEFIENIIGPTEVVLLKLRYVFLEPILFIENQYKKLGESIGRILESSIFRGTAITVEDIFFAEDAEEARDKLDKLSNDIDRYGRRFYNLGYQVQKALDPAINTIDILVLRIGILLKRLDIYKLTILDVIGSFNILGTVVTPIKDLFSAFSQKALSGLSTAKEFIIGALHDIERAFFWVYDKVIGNSWWTDTMEMTAGLAQEYLGKTIQTVKSFSRTVSDQYAKAFASARESLKGLSEYTALSNLKIQIDLKQELKDFLEDPKDYILKALEGVINRVGKPITEAVSGLYKAISETSPVFAAMIASVFGSYLVGIFSASLGAGMRKFIGLGLLATAGGIIANSFGEDLLGSGVIRNFGKGLGSAAGAFVDAIISNIPNIIRAFGQILIGFGEGLAESLTGVFGLVAKLLMALPIINIIPGLISAALVAYFTGFGPKKLVDNFIKDRQKQFDKSSKALSKSAQKAGAGVLNTVPQIGFLESVLIGRGGGRATLGRSLGILTAIDVALGALVGNNAFTDFIFAGGLIADLMFGRKGTKYIASTINTLFGKIKQAASSLNNINSLQTFLLQLNPKNLAALWQTAMFKAGVAVSSFVNLTKLQMLGTQAITAATAIFTQNRLISAFRNIQAQSVLAINNIGRRTRRVIAGGVVAAFMLWASSASAATESINTDTNSVFSNILNKVNDFLSTPLGLFTAIIFGGSGAGAVGALVLKQVGNILGKVALKVATFTGALSTARAGILSLAILGSGSLLAGVTTVLSSIAGAFLAFIGSLAGIVAGAGLLAGIVGVAIFGEGDTIGDRFRNAENSVRRFFGYATRESAQLRKSLEESLGSFDKIGNLDINFKPFLDSFRFEDIDAEETRRLQRIAEKTNKILSSAQQSIERGDELSRGEMRRVKRAVDIAKVEIVNANLGLTGEGDGASKTGIASRRSFVEPFTALLNNRSLNLVTAGGEIRNALNLAQSASEDVVKAFEYLESEIRYGTPSGIGFAISDILNNDKIVDELSRSVEGTTFVEALDKIQQLTTGINAQAIDTEIFNEFFTTLSDLGTRLSDSEGDGTGYGRLRQDVADQILADLDSTIEKARQSAQSQLRSTVEDKFIQSIESASKLFEGSFDIDKLSETQIAALSTDSLKELTQIINDQVGATQEAYKKTLENTNQNIISDEIRQQFLTRQQSLATALQESILGKLGIFTPDGEVKDEFTGRLESINERLDELQIDALKVLPSSQVAQIQEDEKAATTANTRLLSQLNKINQIQKKLESLDQSKTGEINQQLGLLTREKALLEIMVGQVNARALAEVDRIGAIEDALEKVENAKDIDDALALDRSVIDRALAMNKALELINLSLKEIQLTGIGAVDAGIIQALRRQRDKLKEDLSAILGDPNEDFSKDNDKSDKGQTPFERFVDGLNSAGFGLSIEDAAKLGAKAFERLKGPVNQVLELNKKIVNSNLDDVKGRTAAANAIRKQREEIFKILSLGTLGQKQQAFEGLGIDPELATESSRLQKLGFDLALNRQKLVDLGSEDLELQKQIIAQIERQEYLIDSLTGKTSESVEAIKDAFSSSFKELIKGEATIKDFFNGLLDSISNRIIDTVVDAFTEAFFEAAGLKEMFKRVFDGLFDMGDSAGISVGEGFKEGMQNATEDISKGGPGGFFEGLSTGFKDLFGNLSSMFSNFGSFLLGSGGSGGLFSSLFGISFGGFLGLNSGGIVPRTSFSRDGIDSVPAMLTPGELVVPADKVKDFNKSSNSNTVVNLSITGDVSRQTRQEIVKMLPTIASGVNAQNKERNYKYR